MRRIHRRVHCLGGACLAAPEALDLRADLRGRVARENLGKLAAALAEWRDRASAAFLAAYRDTMTNPLLWPATPQAAQQMLNFFLLEKAIYEIEYELAHRPDWLRVPLTGSLRILSQHPNEAS